MILALLLGGAILTWYIDKVYDGVTDLVNEKGKSIKKPENDGEMRDLGYESQLARRLPWGAQRSRRIGDWSIKNPNPVIDIQGGGENTRVQAFKNQPILPGQIKRFKQIVHNRENLEEYFRFDQYIGGIYQDKRPPLRRLAL